MIENSRHGFEFKFELKIVQNVEILYSGHAGWADVDLKKNTIHSNAHCTLCIMCEVCTMYLCSMYICTNVHWIALFCICLEWILKYYYLLYVTYSMHLCVHVCIHTNFIDCYMVVFFIILHSSFFTHFYTSHMRESICVLIKSYSTLSLFFSLLSRIQAINFLHLLNCIHKHSSICGIEEDKTKLISFNFIRVLWYVILYRDWTFIAFVCIIDKWSTPWAISFHFFPFFYFILLYCYKWPYNFFLLADAIELWVNRLFWMLIIIITA